MRLIYELLIIVIVLLITFPATAQTPTKRVPLCLQFPDRKVLVPCTGVVPVDADTGDAQSWKTLLKGSPSDPVYTLPTVNGAPISSSNPLPVTGGGSGGATGSTIGGAAPNSAQLVAGKDIDGRVKALSVDAAGALNVNCTGCTGGTGGSTNESIRRAFWSESTNELVANQSYTSIVHDNGGSVQGAPTRWNSFACFASSDQSGVVNLQGSNDNNVWFTVQTKSMSGSLPNVYLSQPMFTKYWRCQVINGPTAQGVFILNAAFGM